MIDNWEILDLQKASLALLAGIILGLERELKDKSAGLKTISIITLGSALFSILSYKMGAPNNEATRIASYVVSGIGFLGAGVIFKDGVNVSGLTTASVIWLASAVGMSIGFGEIYLACIFLIAALLLIHSANLINKLFSGVKTTRYIKVTFSKEYIDQRDEIILKMSEFLIRYEEKKVQKLHDRIVIHIEAKIEYKRIRALEDFLIHAQEVAEFEV